VRRCFYPFFFSCLLLTCALAAQTPKNPASSSKPASTSRSAGALPDSGSISNGLYRNATFGFTYKMPFGWVDRTRDINEDSSPDAASPKKSVVLLASFERPPEATGNTVNSAVVIAAEAVSSYPGLQSAAQYFGPLTEVTKSKGLKVVNEPYDYTVGAKPLARGDFSKSIADLTMHQSTLVTLEKGYVVSFTFIGGTQDEVDDLIEHLNFGGKNMPAPRK
jgi:hypothetical protein